jgi:hypothetical protein
MPATQWNQLVSDTFTAGRQKNPNYQFKNALSDAKLAYNKQGGSGSCGLMKGGNETEANVGSKLNLGGKKKGTKKHHKKSRKHRKRSRRH